MKNENLTWSTGVTAAKNLCLLPGIFLFVSGLLILVAPTATGNIFDVSDPEILKAPFTLAMGIRQLGMGLIIIFLALTNQPKALGLIMLLGAIVPAADFFIFRPVIGAGSALRHAAPVPLIATLGIYLLLKTRKNR